MSVKMHERTGVRNMRGQGEERVVIEWVHVVFMGRWS